MAKKGKGKKKQTEPVHVEVDDDQVDLLAQLALDVASVPVPVPEHANMAVDGNEGVSKGRNRAKERLARKKAEIEAQVAQAALEAEHLPDLRKIERENVSQMASRLGLVEHEIAPDGHCLFAAFADQLEQRAGIKTSVSELRSKAALLMRVDADTFAPFLFDEDTMTVRDLGDYTAKLESTPMWGGDLEIMALAKVYGVTVGVVVSGGPVMTINDGEGVKMMLAYYKHSYGLGAHYNSLRDSNT
ncbi:hypothetical protein V1512DRAFT_268601 [Lipomyces arxii]|uniref:uncharacterized protein n=1 Tax=Lipomyces arxii TaxID=56418 RepID=UPI0034CF8835